MLNEIADHIQHLINRGNSRSRCQSCSGQVKIDTLPAWACGKNRLQPAQDDLVIAGDAGDRNKRPALTECFVVDSKISKLTFHCAAPLLKGEPSISLESNPRSARHTAQTQLFSA